MQSRPVASRERSVIGRTGRQRWRSSKYHASTCRGTVTDGHYSIAIYTSSSFSDRMPVPHSSKANVKRKRKMGHSDILTSTPYKNQLKQEKIIQNAKQRKSKEKHRIFWRQKPESEIGAAQERRKQKWKEKEANSAWQRWRCLLSLLYGDVLWDRCMVSGSNAKGPAISGLMYCALGNLHLMSILCVKTVNSETLTIDPVLCFIRRWIQCTLFK